MTRQSPPKKAPPTDPFAPLKALKAKMAAEEGTRLAAEAKTRRAAIARGEIVEPPRPRPPTVPTAVQPTKVTREPPGKDVEARAFALAMSGVVPLAAGPSRVSSRDPAGASRRPSLDTRIRQSAAAGGPALVVTRHPDGSVTGLRAGRSFALEALGRFAVPQDTCDLHRLDAVTAAARVVEFIRTRRARNLRVVCIVHGQGHRSPDGTPVLREAVVDALSKPPAANDIDAFATAPAGQGGLGAILVSLCS